jgi:hypothetical protein
MSKKTRFIDQFKNIKDHDIKEIISRIVTLEQQHRSSSRDNFPKQSVRDIIDSVARQKDITKGNEI